MIGGLDNFVIIFGLAYEKEKSVENFIFNNFFVLTFYGVSLF